MKNRQVVRLGLCFVITASFATAGLTAQPASAKGFPCVCVGLPQISTNNWVSRLSASVSDGGSSASVSTWLDRTGVPRVNVSFSTSGGTIWGTGVLEEFFVDPALGSGKAVGTFESGGRTFDVEVTLEGTGDSRVYQPGVDWWLIGGVYYEGGEVVRNATGVGTVAVSGMNAVNDAPTTSATLAHALG